MLSSWFTCKSFLVVFCVLSLPVLISSFAQTAKPAFVTVVATDPLADPPEWALLERQLIDAMNHAAPVVLKRYTHSDGTLMWPTRPDFRSIDALDDAYESFHTWPMLYLLGGDEQLLRMAQTQFDTITLHMASYESGKGYPMVVKEYQPAYDWFHQGEGNMLFYLLSMADPKDAKTVERAKRFAGFFMNEDPDAQNYDPALKLIKCAHNGSKGPGFWNFQGGSGGMDGYGLPFYDVPGITSLAELRQNRETARQFGQIANARRGKGDTAMNLASTSLVTTAFLLTGEEKYRAWVKEYVDAWRERTRQNNGIVPDNVGLSGKIGEYMDGKWYGGNYGWTFPHGWMSFGVGVMVAGENASLLLKDPSYLDFPRSQIDMLMKNGVVVGEQLYVPQKYAEPGKVNYRPAEWTGVALRKNDAKSTFPGDKSTASLGSAVQINGWFDFMQLQPEYMAHIWSLSQDPGDMARDQKLSGKTVIGKPNMIPGYHMKDQGGHEGSWLAYLRGEYPTYPEDILKLDLSQVDQRLAYMKADTEDPSRYGDFYFQARNPVTCEGLVQMTMGGPLPFYNGGLLVAQVRYFDAQRKRPGLPANVAALVSGIVKDAVTVQLVNLSPKQSRELIIQAGTMGEHQFTTVVVNADLRATANEVNNKFFLVSLPPATRLTLKLGIKRFVNNPTYQGPWD